MSNIYLKKKVRMLINRYIKFKQEEEEKLNSKKKNKKQLLSLAL